MKTFLLVFTILSLTFTSCRECKECYFEEVNTQTADTVITPMGKQCGSDLKETDGKEYKTGAGSARSYCVD